ncbi:conserved hypothetical protein [Leishmania major strain Friedlin]|uniref:Peptidase S9 prolyl oligopeptidase catalytic domain-containing protein n=1 Tax=Leishmania major TaxID=5664 RepID=Q4Q0V0_LEIMA|nr:conserved hypothetical protein [Leishmania major strain Friedlin]CAG9584012.1 Esterase_PHB_depolymerase/Prolyl_oligopeptidase_family_-_putative [Leishmania major strain Friedlin]CAJ09432.1 conserved hypothetical protein [Leishmania major strain Friedlin]|eukprot:XP_001687048.1 conserved hypothetical protein [Leishmania major strain Friedlin]
MSDGEVVFEDATGASSEKTPLKGDMLDAPPRKVTRSRAEWLRCVTVACVLLLIAPLYLWTNFHAMRAAREDPISVVTSLSDNFDIHELIRELNDNGEKIYISSLISKEADGCARDVPGLPKGKQTVVTFKTLENTEREAVVYVPTSYPTAPKPGALLLLFHGLNDNCKRFLDGTGFVPYAELDGFVLVSVCGSLGYLGTGWNAGMCCGFLGEKPNDVAFAKQLVTELSQSVCIDKTRVMAAGFSNGAMLAEVLACDAPEIFRAVASVSGVVEIRPGNDAALAACTAAVEKASSTARTSVLMVHGTADLLVPWDGNKLLGFPSMVKNLEGWRERNGCTDETSTTISTDTYVNTIYTNCSVRKPAGLLPTFDGEPEELQTGLEDNPYWGMDAVANKTGDALSTVEDTALADGERCISRMEAEYLSVRQESRRHVTRLTHERWSRDQRCQKRDRTKAKNAKAHEKHDDKEVYHRKVSSRNHHESMDFHLRPHLYLKEKLSQQDVPRQVAVNHRRPHHLPFGSVPKERCEVRVQRDGPPHLQNGTSQVELVRVKGGGHHWPRDVDFSTTDYIYCFGIRVFGRYN